MAWTSPRTWVSGETVTAALMNTHVRDNLKAIGDAWGTYTPTWTATVTNPSLGNGSLTGRFAQAGKMTWGWVRLVAGSTTTFGSGGFRWVAPANARDAASSIVPIGTAVCWDNSAASHFHRLVVADNTNAMWLVDLGGNQVNNTTPFTFATNDYINIRVCYEAA